MGTGIWQKGREFFIHHRTTDLVPVCDLEFQFACFAYQDTEADREIRMLRELDEGIGLIGFRELYPDCIGVMIHGCNELAWHMKKYLERQGIAVYVEGRFWKELGVKSDYDGQPDLPIYASKTDYHDKLDYNFEIWAEGVQLRNSDFLQKRLRSASVEFECVNEIYEANIKAGKITDAAGDADALLDRLKREKQIVIRGVGTKAQDAYDWLLSNNIGICAFQSGKENNRKSLFGIPILRKNEVEERFKEAVVIECSEKYSAWGFGDVDQYDYEGYERNKRYVLLRDYIEVPENNLVHLLRGRQLVFLGDIRLCHRVYRWIRQNGMGSGEMQYWDILGESVESRGFPVNIVNDAGVETDNVCLLVRAEYSDHTDITDETTYKCDRYLRCLKDSGIYDYTDYFSDSVKYIHLEIEEEKHIRKKLCPAGIMIGAIPAHCGNTLVRQSFAGHPQILMIEEYGYFNNNLYSICIRLAEEQACDVISAFRLLYQTETSGVDGDIEPAGFNKEKFYRKMDELLGCSERFTSQELFVIFHLAYAAGFSRNILDLNKVIIYWEPHMWSRDIVKELAYWFSSKGIKCFVLRTVRNRYTLAESRMRNAKNANGLNVILGFNIVWKEKRMAPFEEQIVTFEDLKCKPREVLIRLCEWTGIPFSDVLLETTYHGEQAFYDEERTITGFDLALVYNLAEEYFSEFDRMRICLVQGSYQRQYGYPYVSCLEFSRRELQEMFLKSARWEKLHDTGNGMTQEKMISISRRAAKKLWQMRFAEIMEIAKDHELQIGY